MVYTTVALRACALTLALGFCFIEAEAQAQVSPASEQPGLIQLDASFPPATRRDLLSVARNVLALTQALFPDPPPAGIRPIVCFYRAKGPITDSTTDPSRYHVGLSVTTRHYARFAYQLGHELGHVYLDPRRTSGLVETLAVAISLRVLDDMSELWARRPPYPHWRSYAAEFRRYRENEEARHLASFPPEVADAVRRGRWQDVALYLAYRREDQDRDATDRHLNILGALTLRAERLHWTSYRGIGGLTDPSPADDPRFRRDLLVDLTRRPELDADMRRIGRGAGISVSAAPLTDREREADGFILTHESEVIQLVAQHGR